MSILRKLKDLDCGLSLSLAKETAGVRLHPMETDSTDSNTPQSGDAVRPSMFKFPTDDSFFADDHSAASTLDGSQRSSLLSSDDAHIAAASATAHTHPFTQTTTFLAAPLQQSSRQPSEAAGSAKWL